MTSYKSTGSLLFSLRNHSETNSSSRNLTKVRPISVTPKSSKFFERSHTFSNLSATPLSPTSRTSKYSQMTSNTVIRNLLLDVGSELKHTTLKRSVEHEVIVIQAAFRRYMVMKKIRARERNRQCSKYTIKKECFDNSASWNYIQPLMKNKNYRRYIYNPINRELSNLIEILQNKNEDLHIRIKIFNLLCSCFKPVDRDFISYNDADLFLSKILRVSLDSDQIHELLDTLMDGGNKIHHPTLLEWYLDYTSQYVYKSIIEKLLDCIKPHYPTSFVNSFMSLRSSINDLILSVFVFEKKNPPEFQCPICHGVSCKPLLLSKHIVQCKKNNCNN